MTYGALHSMPQHTTTPPAPPTPKPSLMSPEEAKLDMEHWKDTNLEARIARIRERNEDDSDSSAE